MGKVKLSELVAALAFSSDDGMDLGARVSRETGEIHYTSDFYLDVSEDDLPDDIEDDDRYVDVPDKRSFDLGTPLVRSFFDEVIPEHAHRYHEIFSRKGAYGRFKDFLDRIAKLEAWHAYEHNAQRRALLKWCEEQGLEVIDDEPEKVALSSAPGEAPALRPEPADTRQPITPMLCVHLAAEAIAWYTRALDAKVINRIDYRGQVAHAELQLGNARFMIADEFPEHNTSTKTLGGTPIILYTLVEDVDALVEKAVANRAKLLRPVTDEPHGDRVAKLRDPYGIVWMFATAG